MDQPVNNMVNGEPIDDLIKGFQLMKDAVNDALLSLYMHKEGKIDYNKFMTECNSKAKEIRTLYNFEIPKESREVITKIWAGEL